MATYNYKDKGAVIKFGGGVLIVRPIGESGVFTATITGISQASTAVVTYTDVDLESNLANGDQVLIIGVSGMTQVNDLVFTVANLNTGANTFELQGINSTGYTAYSSGGTIQKATTYNLGYINDSGLRFITEFEDIPDETGGTVISLEQPDVVKFEGMFMQTNKNMIDFLRDRTLGAFYEVYYKGTKTGGINALTQEYFLGIAKIKRTIDVKANTKRINFEFTVLKNESAITVQEPDQVYGSIAATDITIAADTYFTVVEN